MSVQELFDLLNPPYWPYEVDEDTRWDKVHEVLPWLLSQAWCFYEGMGHHETEQPAIGVAAAILDPIGDEETTATDMLQNMGSLAHHMLEWMGLTPSTRAQLEQIDNLDRYPTRPKQETTASG